MGLAAVVYRNKKHMELGADSQDATVIPETGEVYFEDEKLARKYEQQRKAMNRRLGNIALISTLRDEASQLIGPETFLERKVLYSGTHCGDAIALDELDALSADLHRIDQTGRSSPMMQEFMSALQQLIQAAKAEHNPIVFT